MQIKYKQRLIGFIILIALAIIFVPMLFNHPHATKQVAAKPEPSLPQTAATPQTANKVIQTAVNKAHAAAVVKVSDTAAKPPPATIATAKTKPAKRPQGPIPITTGRHLRSVGA